MTRRTVTALLFAALLLAPCGRPAARLARAAAGARSAGPARGQRRSVQGRGRRLPRSPAAPAFLCPVLPLCRGRLRRDAHAGGREPVPALQRHRRRVRAPRQPPRQLHGLSRRRVLLSRVGRRIGRALLPKARADAAYRFTPTFSVGLGGSPTATTSARRRPLPGTRRDAHRRDQPGRAARRHQRRGVVGQARPNLPHLPRLLRQEPVRRGHHRQPRGRRHPERQGQCVRQAVHGPAQGERCLPVACPGPVRGGPVSPSSTSRSCDSPRARGSPRRSSSTTRSSARSGRRASRHPAASPSQRHDMGRRPQGCGLRQRQGPGGPALLQVRRGPHPGNGQRRHRPEPPLRHGAVRRASSLRAELRRRSRRPPTRRSRPRTRARSTTCSFPTRRSCTAAETATTSRSCTRPCSSRWASRRRSSRSRATSTWPSPSPWTRRQPARRSSIPTS